MQRTRRSLAALLFALSSASCATDEPPDQTPVDATTDPASDADVTADDVALDPGTLDTGEDLDVIDSSDVPDQVDTARDLDATDLLEETDARVPDLPPGPDYPRDDTLRLNHIQVEGTHNSYHIEPPTPLDDSHRYTMPTLGEQLAEHGVRAFELDIHWDNRLEGFRVYHLPGIDPLSVCDAFTDCMRDLRGWSDENPGHSPLFVFIEPKDDLDIANPIRGRLGDLETEILSVWPRRRILTPDEVQGDHASLAEALRVDGWPTLGEVRNRVVFLLLDSGRHRDDYTEGGTTLAGRLMFGDFDFGHPLAALSSESPSADALAGGVILRVRAGDVPEGITTEEIEAAVATGGHLVVTDFPGPVDGLEVHMAIPGGSPSGCNPVTAPVDCAASDVENLP